MKPAERFARLAKLARRPETAAIYSARARLAIQYEFRSLLVIEGGLFMGRHIAPKQRFMSEVSR